MNTLLARFYHEQIGRYMDFQTGRMEHTFAMTKLYEIMFKRIKGDLSSPLDITYHDGDFYHKETLLDEDLFTEIEYGFAGEISLFESVLSEGFSMIGKDNGIYLLGPSEYRTDEQLEDFVSSSSDLAVAKFYNAGDEESLSALPDLCSDVHSFVNYDIHAEDDVHYLYFFKSPLIGAYIDCPDIPSEKREEVGELLSEVVDPLNNRSTYSAVKDGVFYLAFEYGFGGYEWTGFYNLSPRWFPTVVMLKKELDRLNKTYRFFRKEECDGKSQKAA